MPIRVISPPEIWSGTLNKSNHETAIFVGGGITDCPDWQAEFIAAIRPPNYGDTILLNPRRENFPIDDPTAAPQQILWERLHIDAADAVVLWFCKETLCPIVLFELGTLLPTNKELFVGTDPDYQRRADVEMQTALFRPDLWVRDKLSDVIEEAHSWLSP